MTNAEAEAKVRILVHDWARETGFRHESGEMPLFLTFKAWLHAAGYGDVFSFRSTRGPQEDVEHRFDQELKQAWRN